MKSRFQAGPKGNQAPGGKVWESAGLRPVSLGRGARREAKDGGDRRVGKALASPFPLPRGGPGAGDGGYSEQDLRAKLKPQAEDGTLRIRFGWSATVPFAARNWSAGSLVMPDISAGDSS